jgi:hypothetical protein
VRGPLAVVAAGTTFAGTVVVALLLGIWLGGARHQEYILVALVVGIAVGGYAAYRLVACALSG